MLNLLKPDGTVIATAESIVWNSIARGWQVGNEIYCDADNIYSVTPITVKSTKVSVIEYKMLFTPAERIAVKNSTDAVIIDLCELMDDPRTLNVDLSLQSISDALDYMTTIGLIAADRKAEILTGIVK